MSQRAVEAVLGRMITDGEFRARFCADPLEVCHENDLVLTAREAAALLRVDLVLLQDVAVRLDPQIVRAASLNRGSSARSSSPVRASSRPTFAPRRG